MHEVLVNRLGGLSLPTKSVVKLTDCPDMTLDVYRGRKTTTQQQQHKIKMTRVAESLSICLQCWLRTNIRNASKRILMRNLIIIHIFFMKNKQKLSDIINLPYLEHI